MRKKSIVITGAASGIGRETALFFAKREWFVGIFDMNEQGLKQLETEIGKKNCFSQVMDVTVPEDVQKCMDAFAAKTGGKLDVLHNNAGIIKFGFFENVSLQEHLRIVDVNLKGCLNCIYYSLSYLKNTPGSRIINMSSISSIYGIPDCSVYSATKHALSAMTEALDIELEKHGIVVCDIKPPFVKTPLLDTPEEVYIVKRMGIHVQPITIAKKVWCAAHKKKLHWKVSITHFFSFLSWLAPFAHRFTIRLLAIPPK